MSRHYYYYNRRRRNKEPETIGEAVQAGIIKGTGQITKDYLRNQIINLRKELQASHNHRTSLHTQYTPSAAHAKKALLNIGKSYNDAGHVRRGVHNQHYIKKARAGTRSQLKYRSTGMPKGVQNKFREALEVKAENMGRKLKSSTKNHKRKSKRSSSSSSKTKKKRSGKK